MHGGPQRFHVSLNFNLILTTCLSSMKRNLSYGLLGASGCGKTTLLSCIVGLKKFDSGGIWVLGGKPRTKSSGIPGPKVGYMPQVLRNLLRSYSIFHCNFLGRCFGRSVHNKRNDILFRSDAPHAREKNRGKIRTAFDSPRTSSLRQVSDVNRNELMA